MPFNAPATRRVLIAFSLIAGLALTLSLFAQSGPAITAIAPNSGAPGSPVRIVGSGFGASVGSSTVSFNGIGASPKQWSNTSITVAVPAGASTGPVLVNVGGAASNAVTFTVSQA